MRQNRHSFLAFPKFNKAQSILPAEAKALLVLFYHLENPIGWIWSSDEDDTLGLA